ncbi:unnamed protein product [Caenorhabditis angaria]|uniref:Uncharacterized protein n=1 Tax=Caenorhabditis angaria TaxID=860376 RepID=A0A9P1J297_9PELO|nr:unnamed protein product [Caenorhabditis angaria]
MQNLALLADVALNESSYRKNLELSKKKMDYSNCPDLQILADAAVKKIEKALTTTTIPRTKKITLPVIMLDEEKTFYHYYYCRSGVGEIARMQTLKNPLSIFRARSTSRNSNGNRSQSQSRKKPAESQKPTQTQKLFVKRDKQASECLAETKIEKKSVCREKTHKSIVIPAPRIYICEKIEKTVQIPKMSQPQKPTPLKKTQEMIEEIFAPLRETIEQGINEMRHNSSSPEKVKSLNHTPSTRLEQWKAQLIGNGSTGQILPRSRDLSAPAPVQRLRMKPQQTQLRVPPASRQLHSTQSATNALSMDHRTLREVPMRNHCGTWQPNHTQSYNADRPPVDFVTSPRLSHQEVICKPIAFRPKPAELINHNDSNKKSFRRVDATIRSDDINGSISDLLLMYHNKDREMNSSMRSSASLYSSSYRCSFPNDNHHLNNQNKTVMNTLSSSSSGIHVTPSPSDSGIIDYENLIRDKEQELQEIRNVMEQNEDIIIKVYQDKERAWKTELEGLKCRVLAAEKGEKALREQLSNCQRQNSAMNQCMRSLQEEKTKLMAKCIQLDKEIEFLRQISIKPCANCNAVQNNEQQKDLRQEVMDLRREVALLKQVVDDEIHLKN